MSEEFEEPSGRSWEDYWAVLLRRRWWVLLPFFFCWAAVWSISWLLPAEYQSASVLGVEQQKVAEQYVTPDARLNLQDRLQIATQEVLTGPRLRELSDQFRLSPPTRGWRSFFESGDPVDRVRQSIKIEPIESPDRPGNYTTFRIVCYAGSSEIARELNEEVTSLFLAENATARRESSQATSTFLDDEVARAQEQLTTAEAKIAAFKERHLGQLPSQTQANVQILGGLQTQLQSIQRALDAARQQKLYLDSLLQEYRAAQMDADGESPNTPSLQWLDGELLALRLKLETLRSHYTEDYPDIAATRAAIAKTEELKKRLSEEESSSAAGDRASVDGDLAATASPHLRLPPPVMEAQGQLKANALEIQNDQQRAREIESQIAVYQSRLNLAPEIEQELEELSSGYEASKKDYDSLVQKQLQSRLAANLEEKQGGEQLRILDPPSLPKRPTSPNRLRISLAGLVIGLAIGLGLAIFRELTDARIQKEEELDGIVPAPLLVGIPRLSTSRESALLRARTWMEIIGATAMIVLVIAGNLCSLYKG